MYNGHTALYADYSHGVRLISNIAFINEDSIQIDDTLKDPNLSVLLSNEGVINKPYYPDSDIFTLMGNQFKNSQMDFKLNQNYPNPFNPSTAIHFSIAQAGQVKLTIYNVAGQEMMNLVDEQLAPRVYKAQVNAQAWPSGLYFYNLTSAGQHIAKRMLLIK